MNFNNRKNNIDDERIKEVLSSLIKNIEGENYRGYDPYDLLNSKINFTRLGHRACFYASQIHKRNPINIRKLLLIKKTINPKSLGLLLSAYSYLYRFDGQLAYLNEMNELYKLIIEVSSKGYSGYCWGLDSNYANRYEILEAYSPSIVVTSFVCSGIFNYYLLTKNEKALEVLKSACDFALNDLDRTVDGDTLCFSYTTTKKDMTYNANGLCAELFSKVYSITKDEKLLKLAKSSTDFNLKYQHDDGRWNYALFPDGTESEQIDFHQGFILDSINNFIKHTGVNDEKYLAALKKGAEFYYNHQFDKNGRSLWRFPKLFPVDIHNQSQGIITFSELSYLNENYLSFAYKIAEWTINNMHSKNGLFYYRKYRMYNNKTSYLRWNQVWMMLALCKLLKFGKRY